MLLCFVLFWVGAFAFVTLTVDPYGVSPLTVEVSGFNRIKPARLNIDRAIKPYEVWRYQPKTIFLGTSRIHQSIDPSVFEGSAFAPAYNAAVPASPLTMNLAFLDFYDELNPNLETVYSELFVYYFFGQGQQRFEITFEEYFRETAALFVTTDALWDSVLTVLHNWGPGHDVYVIKPGGHYHYPEGHDARGPFAGFAAGIWSMAPKGAENMQLHEPAFETMRDYQKLADEKGVDLVFVATPNHAYFDHFVETVGAWPAIEELLTRLSRDFTVVSFSQPNDLVYEPVSAEMKYWNDPFHFSLSMGEAMSRSLIGDTDGLPSDFMMRLTPEMVPAHIATRREAVQSWAAENPDYVAKLEQERLKLQQ